VNDDREICRHAITAMVWVVLGFGPLLFLGTILAFIYAGRADRMIRRHQDELRGHELAASARSLAKAQVVYYLLLLAVAVGAAIAFRDAIQGLQDTQTL
jgi:hypothetical protein